MRSVGILGLGVHLPAHVRENDWWPKTTVERWREKRAAQHFRGVAVTSDPDTPGARRVKEEMAKWHADPFLGAERRHVLDDDKTSLDMEEAAAREAMAAAGVDPRDIDFLLIDSVVPELLFIANAAQLHERLGTPRNCYAVATNALCNSFQQHLSIARMRVESGRAQVGLIVQSSAMSRMLDFESQQSVLFGDAAAAAVIGAVREGRGVQAEAWRVDATTSCGVGFGVGPTKRWYEEGRTIFYVQDSARSRLMFLTAYDAARDVLGQCFAERGLEATDVGFYGSHQPMRWFRPATQEAAGLTRAHSLDTFPRTGNLTGCNLPVVLHAAQREGLLRDDMLVALHAGAAGTTYSGTLLRWGR